MSTLSVNVNMVAALRELGRLAEPDPAQAAVLSELAGADGIAIRLARGQRFIRDRDLYLIKGVVKTKLILEMPPTEEAIDKALEVKPWMVTFVGEHADGEMQASTLDLRQPELDFSDIVARLKGIGIYVGFFVEPDTDQIRCVSKAGASAVLINGGAYCQARDFEQAQMELDRLDKAAVAAAKSELAVHCGRGINYRNIHPLLELKVIDEFVIGSAICARAVLVGYERAVREMAALVNSVPRQG